ncbi:MAG: hypothetical protein AAF539_04880 [Planctomycetota bacterium]
MTTLSMGSGNLEPSISEPELFGDRAALSRHFDDARGLIVMILSSVKIPACSLFAMSVVACVLINVALHVFSREVVDVGHLVWVMAMMQLPFLGFAVFGFDIVMSEMDSTDSTVIRFLVRSPVASFVLAGVPLLLKGIATGVSVALMFAALTPVIDRDSMQLFLPFWLGAWSIGVWTSVLSWRPFVDGWQMFLLFATLILVGIAVVVLTTQTTTHGSLGWLAPRSFPIPIALTLAVGIKVAFSSMILARTNDSAEFFPRLHRRQLFQSVRDTAKPFIMWMSGTWPMPETKSAKHAITWYDRNRVSHWVSLVRFGTVLSVLVPVAFSRGEPALVAFGSFFTAFFAATLNVGGVADLRCHRPGNRGRLTPLFLAASPIQMESFVAVIMRRCVRLSLIIGSSYLAMIAILACIPERFVESTRWMSSYLSDSTSLLQACVWFGCLHLMVTLSGAVLPLWLMLRNQRSITILATVIANTLIFGFILGFIAWILNQSDWDVVLATRDRWVAAVRNVLRGLLIAKVLLLIATWRSEAARPGSQKSWRWHVLLAWFVIASLVAIAGWVSMPTFYPQENDAYQWIVQPTITNWLTLVCLLIPLSRILILPSSLAWDIHHR